MSKVFREGAEGSDGGSALMKSLQIGNEIVDVTFVRLKNNVVCISNAWVRR